MKKNNPLKIKNAAIAFALALTSLNAAEQRNRVIVRRDPVTLVLLPTVPLEKGLRSTTLTKNDIIMILTEGLESVYKTNIIEAIEKVSPDHYGDFINTFNQLSKGMYEKKGLTLVYSHQIYLVISSLSNVKPDHYQDFVITANQISKEMNIYFKGRVIEILGSINPGHYRDIFIKTVNELPKGMDLVKKLMFMNALGNASPAHYTDFINIVNAFSQGMDSDDKLNIINSLLKINPDLYPFLQTFIRGNSRYFDYVPVYIFRDSITLNMTQESLQNLFQNLHAHYYYQAPATTPQALAFEIHRFSNQEVVGETGEKQKFNDAVLENVKKSIKGELLEYEKVLQILSTEKENLKYDPIKSGAINDQVYRWVILNNTTRKDKDAIVSIITYLTEQKNRHAMLQTWLYIFMDESNNAYNSGKKGSCTVGIKERAITSLRSTVLLEGGALSGLFKQGEEPFMIETKSKKLTDYPFWAKKLLEQNVKSTSNKEERIAAYRNALNEYYETLNGAEDVIQTMVDEFGDENAILWSKIKSELENIEPKKPEAAQSTSLNEDERREHEAAQSTPGEEDVTAPSLDLEIDRAFDAFKNGSTTEEIVDTYGNALSEYFDTLNGAEDIIQTADKFGDDDAIFWSKIKAQLEKIEPKKPEAARSAPLNENERREPEAARSTPAKNVTVPSLDLETGRAFDAFKTEYLNDKMNSRKPHAFMRAATEYANHHPELNRDLFLEISKEQSNNLR